LGDDGQGEGGLAGAVGAVDLGDAAPGDAADPDSFVEVEAAGGNRRHRGWAVEGGGHAGAQAAVDLASAAARS
jgi:hypothetical protein